MKTANAIREAIGGDKDKLDLIKEMLNEIAPEHNYGEIKSFNQIVNFCENCDAAMEIVLA